MSEVFVNDTYPKSYFDAALAQKNSDGAKTTNNAWKSKPRKATSGVTEILTYEFASRSSISSVAFDIQSAGATYEFSYVDSNGKEQPLLRDDYNQVKFSTISRADWTKWQHWDFECLPCVSVKLIIRMVRVNDALAPAEDYSLAISNLAIKRSITTRDQAALSLSKNTDILGNVISKTVKDWEPKNAIDGDDYSFWKSEPQPAQDAVVSLYLDVRDEYKQGQFVDSVWLDPVYMGSQLNIYYSNDDTTGNRVPSFKTYDVSGNNADWSENGYSMLNSDSSLSFSLKEAQFDRGGSWFTGLHWNFRWPRPDGDARLFAIGDRCYITMRADDKFEFTFPSTSGMRSVLLDFPDPILATDTNAESPVLTDIKLEFGIDRDGTETACVRASIRNYNLNNQTISEKTSEARLDLSTQLSAIADGVDAFTEVSGDIKLHATPYEVEVPANREWQIPISGDSAAIRRVLDSAGSDAVKARISVEYRTDAEFNSGSSALVKGGLSIPTADYYTEWNGSDGLSSSSLYKNSKLCSTNYATGGYRIASPFYNKTNAQHDYATGMDMISFTPATSGTNELGALEFSSRTKSHFSISAGQYKAVLYASCTPSLQSHDFTMSLCRAGDVIVQSSFRVSTAASKIVVPVTVDDDLNEAYISISCTDKDGFAFSDSMSLSTSMFFGTQSDWNAVAGTKYEMFDGATKPKDAIELTRYSTDLSLNPTMSPDKWQLGNTVFPTWATGKPTDSYMSMLAYGDNEYDDVVPWIDMLPSSVYLVSFYCKSKNGFSNPKPYMRDSAGKKYACERYQTSNLNDSWRLIYCRVRLPDDFKNDVGSFGITEEATNAFTVISDLHIYNAKDASEEMSPYTIKQMEIALDVSSTATPVDIDDLVVSIVNYADMGSIFVKSVSVQILSNEIAPVGSDDAVIGRLHGDMKQFIMKQQSLNDIAKDKFLQDPLYYLSPDFYDSSSTLYDSLVYCKATEEEVFRGGVSDAFYMNKLWLPVMIGAKLSRQNYKFPATVKAKFIKLEMTQLSPQQYEVADTNVSSNYLTYPISLTKSMSSTTNKDTTNVNTKTTVDTQKTVTKFENNRETDKKTYLSRNASDKQSSSSVTNTIFSDPQYEISTGKPSMSYTPGMFDKPMSTSTHTEKTSAVIFTGQTKDVKTAFDHQQSKYNTYQTVAHHSSIWVDGSFNYRVNSGDCIWLIAQKFGIANWWSVYAINTWVDGDPRLRYLPGRSAGWWIFPGQSLKIPSKVLKQITTYSTNTIVHKTSTQTKSVTTVTTDTNVKRDTTTVNGSQGFTKPSIHYYETRSIKRTNSIAFFAAIRELKVKVADYYYEQDNQVFDYYSMDMPIWHHTGGYVTANGSFTPSLTDGVDKAVIQSDPCKTQSFFRTIQVKSCSSSTVLNRKTFDLQAGTSWHDILFWEANPTMNCDWDDATENKDNPANGGVWDSKAYSWGDAFTSTVTQGDSKAVWYDSELVKEYVVNPSDIKLSPSGDRTPFVIRLGTVEIPDKTNVQMSASIFQLVKSTLPGQKFRATFKIVSASNEEQVVREEDVWLDSEKISGWQTIQTSRFKMFNMAGSYEILLYLDQFSQLDFYIKDAYVETGTIAVYAKNTDSPYESDWEDISSALIEPDSEYTFRNAGNAMQVRVEMIDPQDWFSAIKLMPTYIPYEDAVNYVYDQDIKPDTAMSTNWLGVKDYSASHLQLTSNGNDDGIVNLAMFAKPAVTDVASMKSAGAVVNDTNTYSGSGVRIDATKVNSAQVDSKTKDVRFIVTDIMSRFDYSTLYDSMSHLKFLLKSDAPMSLTMSVVIWSSPNDVNTIYEGVPVQTDQSWRQQDIHLPKLSTSSGQLAVKLSYSDPNQNGMPSSISMSSITLLPDADQDTADAAGIRYFDGDGVSTDFDNVSSKWLGTRDSSYSSLAVGNPRVTSFWSSSPQASWSMLSKNVGLSNLLSNADFESDMTSWNASNAGLIAIDTSQHHSGSKSVKFSSRTGQDSDKVTSDAMPVIEGHTYAVSFFAKTTMASPSSDLILLQAGSLNDSGSYDIVNLQPTSVRLDSSMGWAQYVALYTSKSDSMQFIVAVANNKLGSADSIWVDDCTLVDVTYSDSINLMQSPSIESGKLDDFYKLSGNWTVPDNKEAGWIAPHSGQRMLRANGGNGSYSISTKPIAATSRQYHLSFYANVYDSRSAKLRLNLSDGSTKELGSILGNKQMWQRNDIDIVLPDGVNWFTFQIYDSYDIRYDDFLICTNSDWIAMSNDGVQSFDGSSYSKTARSMLMDARCVTSWNSCWQSSRHYLPGFGVQLDKAYGKDAGTVSNYVSSAHPDGTAVAIGDTLHISTRIISSTANWQLTFRVNYSDGSWTDTTAITGSKVNETDTIHRFEGMAVLNGDSSKTVSNIQALLWTWGSVQMTECLVLDDRDWNLMKSVGIRYFDGDKVLY